MNIASSDSGEDCEWKPFGQLSVQDSENQFSAPDSTCSVPTSMIKEQLNNFINFLKMDPLQLENCQDYEKVAVAKRK